MGWMSFVCNEDFSYGYIVIEFKGFLENGVIGYKVN